MNLKKLRKERNLLQSDIAKALNIPPSTYGGYELGAANPSIETLIKLANFYNVSLDYLLDRPYSAIGYVPETRVDGMKEIANLPDTQFNMVMAYVKGIKDGGKQ